MDDDIGTVDEFPAITGGILVSVGNLKTEIIQFSPNLMGDTFEVADAGNSGDNETISPGTLLRYIKDAYILALMVFKKLADRLGISQYQVIHSHLLLTLDAPDFLYITLEMGSQELPVGILR